MSSQGFSLFFRFWLSVCCISNFASALGGMDINSRDVDTGYVELNPLESFSLDSCEILLSTGQITFEDGDRLPFQYSNVVLENGCFSCYSTEPQNTVYRSTPLTIAGPYYGSAGGTTQYVEIDTLVVVYPHYRNMSVRMDLSTADIEILKAEVAKSKRFLWRSSNLKCLMNTEADWIVIDRTLTPAQLWDVGGPGSYWLTYWSIDGAASVEQDLYDAGIVDGQYSVVIVLYAFENSEDAKAAYGGAMYGVDIGFMGNTAYIAIPLAWGLEREGVITHEYIHALDSIFTQSGNPGGNDMHNPDRSALFPYATDTGRHLQFLICNVLNPESWLQLDPQWARLSTAPDNDGDGVPDSGDLPITEETLGSLPTKTDTDDDGLIDLGELTAAFYRESNPLLPDTDGDGLLDGNDPFPLYSCNDQISHGEAWIDGFIGEDEYVEVVSSYVRGNPDIGATIYATWSEGILYLAFDITDDNVKTPYKGTFWAFNDNIEINIDSQQDGWRWSDDRNYRFCVVPMGSGGNPFVFGEYKSFATGSNETHEIDVSTLSAKYALRPGGYRVEMAIPASLMPEVDVNSGSSMRLTFWVRDYDAYGDWPKFNIFTGMSGDVPGFVKVYLVSRDGQMVGYWKLDETSGSIAQDSAGNNNGTLNGEPVWQPTGGKVDGALELNGIDDYVSTPFILDPTAGSFSAFAWINGGAPGQVIISQTDGTGSGGTWIGSETSDGKLMTGLVSPAVGRFVPQPMESELIITDGQWHHIGFVWDGSYRYLYVDGIEVAKDTKALAPLKSSDGGLYFGAGRALDAASFWSGLIDGVCIYGQALGSEDVETLYVGPSLPDSLSEALDTALSFSTGGSADWFSQTTTSRYDGDAAQSGDISDEQNSWMQTTVSGKGTVSFYWKVSSESNFDFLEFYIDGELQDRISGSGSSVRWQQKTHTISTSGSHVLEWRYVKDRSRDRGSDCGWVDKVEWGS